MAPKSVQVAPIPSESMKTSSMANDGVRLRARAEARNTDVITVPPAGDRLRRLRRSFAFGRIIADRSTLDAAVAISRRL